jgi:hypothetical protein
VSEVYTDHRPENGSHRPFFSPSLIVLVLRHALYEMASITVALLQSLGLCDETNLGEKSHGHPRGRLIRPHILLNFSSSSSLPPTADAFNLILFAERQRRCSGVPGA